MSPPRHHHALPEGYTLHWYEIDTILGQGGFGITYLARDTNLDQPVAIKEFLPSDLATRTRDSAVHPLSAGHTDTYGWGLNRFLTEARTLAKFRHPNIVRVLSVFEANNTAYMVMEYERGESLENLLRKKGLDGEQALENLLLPLLDGLERVHETGFIHRDIKPSNIYLREDGVPVLLDFGSARLALGVETRTLTSLVSPGYAPFEQYNATRDSDKQGPWTDIYALGATLYRAVTGKGPVDAAARADVLLEEKRDAYVPCATMGLEGYSPRFLEAIDWALAFSPSDRPQSVADWRRVLLAPPIDQEAETLAVSPDATSVAQVDFALDAGDDAAAPEPAASAEISTGAMPTERMGARMWLVAGGMLVGVGVAAAAWLLSRGPPELPPGTLIAAAPGDSGPGKTTAPVTAGAAPAASTTATGESADSDDAPRPTESGPRAPASAGAAAPPSAATAAVSEPAVESAEAAPSMGEAPAGERTASAPVAGAASAATSAPRETTRKPTPPAQEAPAPEPPTAASARKAPPAPAAAPEKKAPPPAAAPAKKAPEPVARVAPAKKAVTSPPPAKKATTKAPREPQTREEKVQALLVTADAHLRADRLTKPRRGNALRDYLTVLAMDTDNAQARRGVERIVERYLALAGEATADRRFQAADEALGQTRFVLDAMDLRHWPDAPYDSLWNRYVDATQALRAAR